MKTRELEKSLSRWGLSDAAVISLTVGSEIYKVRKGDSHFVLKILKQNEMQFAEESVLALRYFDGLGSIQLIDFADSSFLLEYVDGPNLTSLASDVNDTQACEVICEVLQKLHRFSYSAPTGITKMNQRFNDLYAYVQRPGIEKIYLAGADIARQLIQSQGQVCILHGDIHHENILRCSKRGWLAIDPKPVVGEPAYDLANVFYNPKGKTDFLMRKELIRQRSEIFSKRLRVDQKRTLEYALAFGCLSSIWSIDDGNLEEANVTKEIAECVRDVLKEFV